MNRASHFYSFALFEKDAKKIEKSYFTVLKKQSEGRKIDFLEIRTSYFRGTEKALHIT